MIFDELEIGDWFLSDGETVYIKYSSEIALNPNYTEELRFIPDEPIEQKIDIL